MKQITLEDRVKNLENLLLKNENKEVGSLYHYCTTNSMIFNLNNNSITAREWDNKLSRTGKALSLTRDKSDSNLLNLIRSIGSLRYEPVIWRLELDGTKIAERYRVAPFSSKKGMDLLSVKTRQKEEFMEVDLNNLTDYIKSIKIYNFITKDTDGNLLLKNPMTRGLRKPKVITEGQIADIIKCLQMVKSKTGNLEFDTVSKDLKDLSSFEKALG